MSSRRSRSAGTRSRADAQQLVEVLPERAAAHELLEVGAGRGDRAQVEAAARVRRVRLAQRGGEPHLERRRQRVDRVEIERSAVRRRAAPGPRARRAPPNSRCSRSRSDPRAQSTTTNGPLRRGDWAWIARAIPSRPVPGSPASSSAPRRPATRSTCSSSSIIARDAATIGRSLAARARSSSSSCGAPAQPGALARAAQREQHGRGRRGRREHLAPAARDRLGRERVERLVARSSRSGRPAAAGSARPRARSPRGYGHAPVAQHEVEARASSAASAAGALGCADHFAVRPLERALDLRPARRVAVDDQDARRHRARIGSRRAARERSTSHESWLARPVACARRDATRRVPRATRLKSPKPPADTSEVVSRPGVCAVTG